jgi:transposase
MLPNNCKIMLYNKVVDMRKSIDGLSILVSDILSLNPSDGSIYIFFNKKHDKLKMLYWDKNGFTLLYKRLEKEKFKIPNLLSVRSITHDQLRWLFDGLDIDKITGFKSLQVKPPIGGSLIPSIFAIIQYKMLSYMFTLK